MITLQSENIKEHNFLETVSEGMIRRFAMQCFFKTRQRCFSIVVNEPSNTWRWDVKIDGSRLHPKVGLIQARRVEKE